MRLLLVLLCVLWAAPSLAGTVEGTVTIESPPRKKAVGRKTRALRYQESSRYPERAARPAATDEVLYVVVHLVGKVPGGRPAGTVSVVQKGREFEPHVSAVKAGSTVQFPNRDDIYHGIYSESAACPFELPEYPKGESRSVRFDKPGVVEIFCGIHPHMNAYVLVLENGHFAQPGADHRYRLEGVPPGRYVVRAWHPRLKAVTRTVEVKDGAVRLDLKL